LSFYFVPVLQKEIVTVKAWAMAQSKRKGVVQPVVDENEIYRLASDVAETRAKLECWLQGEYGRVIFPDDSSDNESPGEVLFQAHLVSLIRLLSEASAPSYTYTSDGEEHVLFKNYYWKALSFTLIDRNNTLPEFPEELSAPHILQ